MLTRFLVVPGFIENAPPDGYNRIGGEYHGLRIAQRLGDDPAFFTAQPFREAAGRLVRSGRFVDVGGGYLIRDNTDLRQKLAAAR